MNFDLTMTFRQMAVPTPGCGLCFCRLVCCLCIGQANDRDFDKSYCRRSRHRVTARFPALGYKVCADNVVESYRQARHAHRL